MASSTNPKTIHLAPTEIRIKKEAKALSTITPGQFIERAPGGVRRHTTAGGPAQLSIAKEMAMVGGTIDEDYLTNDLVEYFIAGPGETFYGLLAAGQNVSVGDLLSVIGGNLREAQPGDHIVAQALEAVNNSGGADPARIRAETFIALEARS